MKTTCQLTIRRHSFIALALVLLYGMVSAASAEENTVTTKDIMTAMVIPASDALWAIGMDDESTPKPDEYWAKLQNSAVQLMVAGMVMSTHGDPNATGKDKQKKWQGYSKGLISVAETALKAARAKNFDGTLDAGNTLLDTCSACHMDFMPGTQ